MNEHSEEILKRQDWLCYYMRNFSDKSIGLVENFDTGICNSIRDILAKVLELDDSILEQFSIKNLMHIIGAIYKDQDKKNRIIQIIIKKLEKEPFDIEPYTGQIFLKKIEYTKIEFNALPENITLKIKGSVIERGKQIKGTSCEKIARNFVSVMDYANFITCFEKGIFTDEKVEVLEQMLEEDSEALRNVNFNIFEDNIYKLGKDFIKYLAKFPNLSAQFVILQKNNPQLFQVLARQIQNSTSFKDDLNSIEHLVRYFTKNCYHIQLNSIDEKVESELISSALLNNKSKRDTGIIAIPYCENYEENLKKSYLKEYAKIRDDDADFFKYGYKGYRFEIYGEVSKLDIIKNIYLNEHFSISKEEAESLIEMYEQESNTGIFANIKRILEAENESELDFESTIRILPQQIEKIKTDLEKKYLLSYKEELGRTSNDIRLTKNRKVINFRGKEVVQIDIPHDFSILLHSTDTGFIYEKSKIENYDFKQGWKSGNNNSNHIISMTYNNQDFMGIPPVHENGVMYGFTNFNKDNIKLMGNTDINILSAEFGYDSKIKKYLTANAMPYHSRRVYSEFGVEREGVDPDYVIIFDDSTEAALNNAYKAASDWNIPVIYIDKEKVKERQIQNLEHLRIKFENERNPELLKELLNTYETNMAGWLLNRKKDFLDESYTQSINNERFRESFEQEYQKILVTLDRYLDGIDNKNNNQDLLRIMEIVLEERDLYEHCDKTKSISKTESTIETSTIIQKLNNTMIRLGLESKTVDVENIPTSKEYRKRINMENIVKNALVSGIDSKEISTIEAVMRNQRNIEKESRDRSG